MQKRLLAALLLPSFAAAASELSLQGASGALTTPSAEVIKTGQIELQLNTDPRQAGARSTQGEARSYLLGIGLLPRVELTGRLAAPDITIPGGFADLSANLKVSLYESSHIAVAAGILDLAGDSQTSRSRYFVGTGKYKMLSASLGYGDGQSLDGVFGSIAITPYPFVSLLGDYDGQFVSAGARLRHHFGNGTKVALTTKLYSDGFEKTSYGFSLSRDLDFHGGSLLPDSLYANTEAFFRSDWFAENRDGLRNISQRAFGDGEALIVRAENAAYLQRQADSDKAACDQVQNTELRRKVVYDQYRYGLPIISTALDCSQDKALHTTTTWLTQWQDRQEIVKDFSRLSAYGAEVRLTPDLRSFAATEVGIFDYSLALFSTARLQLPAGLGAYITYESPLSSTKNYDDPQLFEFYKHRRGVREAQVQWANHLLPGLFGLHSVGMSSVNAIDYKSQRHDFVYHLGQGFNQFYGSYGRYKPQDFDILPTRKIKFLGYRLFIPQYATSIEADKGEYFYGDDGYRIRANRHFGDTIVTLFVRRSNKENQVAGLELSFPLTPRRGLSAGPLTVVGDPRFRFVRGTSFGQSNGFNELRPLLIVEPEADYELGRDWLDSDRLFPAYPSGIR